MTVLAKPAEPPPDRMAGIGEHKFGCSAQFSLGIEEELLVVDPGTFELLPTATDICRSADRAKGRLATEIYAAEIELITPVCSGVGEAVSVLSSLRQALRSAGATTLGTGVHPTAPLGRVVLNRDYRYREVASALKGILRTPTAALHVHVGMPDPETAIRVANGMRRHVPLLHALAANSPFWGGADSGLASSRAAILRSYPRTELPRSFHGWDDFCATADALARTAGVPDYTYFWWEIRPHPRLGTLEIRAVDTQSSLERTAGLAALTQSLARMEAERPSPTPSQEVLAECSYQATRYGLRARLLDDNGIQVPAEALARWRLAQAAPFARELDAESALLGVERILSEGNGADRQRLAFRRGGFAQLLRQVAGETAREPAL